MALSWSRANAVMFVRRLIAAEVCIKESATLKDKLFSLLKGECNAEGQTVARALLSPPDPALDSPPLSLSHSLG